MDSTDKKPIWKPPTIREIADLADVGPATVDRVLNNRDGVRPQMRQRVIAAMEKLRMEARSADRTLRIRLFSDSGIGFNEALSRAEAEVNRSLPGAQIEGTYQNTSETDPNALAKVIIEEGADADGVIIVAREHPAFNGAVRKLEADGVPVICLTTDLPSSRRSVYVGNDQYASGSVAGLLIGNALERREGQRILFVMSEAFRCQQEREMGFRRTLRNDFPYLRIDERVIVDDNPENSYRHLVQYIQSNGLPAAIYNVAGANRGIARALQQHDELHKCIFVGHELTHHTQSLLEEKVMDYVISHDFTAELRSASQWIISFHQGVQDNPPYTPILVNTRYNCAA